MRKVLSGAALATLVFATAPASAQQASTSEKVSKAYAPAPMPRRGFNVVLLVGEMTGPGYPKPIPAVAMKAVSDMRDFLPYKGYSLLDTQWIVGGNGPALTRLRGLDGTEYELELRASPVAGTGAPDLPAMSVRFVLRDIEAESSGEGNRAALHSKEPGKGEPGTQDIAREIFPLERERADLEIVAAKGRQQVEVGAKDPVEVKRTEAQLAAVNKRLNELKQSLTTANAKAAGRPVIDTSFRMDDGETVVVGTSKMKSGSRALIALVTATSDRGKSPGK